MPENLPVISRPRDGAMLGGVCAGLARRWHLDPNLLRIAVVVLAVFGGLGLVAYGAGLLLMPRDGQAELPVRRYLPFTRTWSTGAVVALVLGAAAVLIGLAGWNGIGLGPAVVIFLVWYFGFRARGSGRPLPPPEPTPFERAAENWRQRLVEQQTPGYAPVSPQRPAQSPLPEVAGQRWTQPYTDPATDLAVTDDDPSATVVTRRRPRRSWRLWWLAMALGGAAVLVVNLLGLAGFPATPLAYAGAVLGALGLTLLAGTRRGRPPLLLPVTLITAMATGALMMSTNHLAVPSVGEQHYSYSFGSEMPAALSLSAGELTVDLSTLDLDADQTLDVHVGVGQLNLILPTDEASEVAWTVRTGTFSESGEHIPSPQERNGSDLAGTGSYPLLDGEPHVLRIRASVGLGELGVQR